MQGGRERRASRVQSTRWRRPRAALAPQRSGCIERRTAAAFCRSGGKRKSFQRSHSHRPRQAHTPAASLLNIQRRCTTRDKPQALLDPSFHSAILGVQTKKGFLQKTSQITVGNKLWSRKRHPRQHNRTMLSAGMIRIKGAG
jgi:hypothetical protein